MITPEISNTSLSSSDSLRIAALGVGLQGEYGAVTDIAREYSVSRPTVYGKAEQAREALARLFEPGARGKVLASVEVDEAQLRRAIVSAYVEGPNSVRDVQALVKAFYGVHVGYGKVFAIIEEAQKRAAAFNRSVRLDAVKASALDELFSQGDPVLAGIDLDTDYLFLLEHHEARGGDDWAEALNEKKGRGLDLAVVVKDAGSGLAAGVNAVFPAAQQRDDAFHARWKCGQVVRRLEQHALAALQELLDTEERHMRASWRRASLRPAGQYLRHARERFEKAADRHRRFELLAQELGDAMEFVDLETGTVRKGCDQQAAIVAIAERMAALCGGKVRGLARYIKNRAPGLALYVDELREKLNALAEDIGGDIVATCTLVWRRLHELGRCPQWRRREHKDATVAVLERLIALAGDQTRPALEATFAVIAKRHRASSAIENFNALLRPYLHVHKRVSQGFLELFMAWRNLRTRPMGKHRGTSAYELLTGRKVDDWLTMLGYPHSQLPH